MAGKCTRARAPLAQKNTNQILDKIAQQVQSIKGIDRHNFCLSGLLTSSNRTTLQSYKVEELTFGTPWTSNFWRFSHVVTALYF